MNDEQLLEHFVSGKAEALAELVKRHTPAMRVYILTRYANGNERLTDAVVEATFNKLTTNHQQFNRRFKLRPWLFCLAANTAIDLKRAAA